MTLVSLFMSIPSDSTESLFINDSQWQATQPTHFLFMPGDSTNSTDSLFINAKRLNRLK